MGSSSDVEDILGLGQDERMKILRGKLQANTKVALAGAGINAKTGELMLRLVAVNDVTFKQFLSQFPNEALPYMMKEVQEEMKARGISPVHVSAN